MTDEDFNTIENLLYEKRRNWNNVLYISLDLSAVSGLTKISDTWALRSLVIPDSVGAFDEYTDLSNVIVSDTNQYLEYDNGVLYSKDKTVLYFYTAEKTDETFTIPSTVSKIWAYSFSYNTSIKKISIPESVNYIGCDAFENQNLQTLTFGNKDNWMAKYYYDNSFITVSSSDLEDVQNYQIDRNTGEGGLLQNRLLFKQQIVSYSDLMNALISYVAGTFTIYKVTGEMTNSEFSELQELIENKSDNIWGGEYVGLDLSEVEGLTRIDCTWGFTSLTIPSSVTE